LSQNPSSVRVVHCLLFFQIKNSKAIPMLPIFCFDFLGDQ
jgi:hypothetical protein